LAGVVKVGLEVEFLPGCLDRGPTDAAAEVVFQLETLSEVVIECDFTEGEELRCEVAVLLGVCVEDVGQRGDRGRGRVGLRDGAGGSVLAVAFGDVDRGTVLGSKPGDAGERADEVQSGGEGGPGLGGADNGCATGSGAVPAVGELMLAADFLVELRLGDEVVDFLGWNGGGC
jgi:hypothetical protein